MQADGALTVTLALVIYSCRQQFPYDNQVFDKGIDLCKSSFLICVTV